MVIILAFLVFFLMAANAGIAYLCFAAQNERDLYYTRWKEANALLEGADLDAVADGKPLLPRGQAKEHKITPWGALEKRTHTQLTQDRLNKMADFSRYEVEKARLREGLEPVDSLEGMGDFYTAKIIALRAKEGWD